MTWNRRYQVKSYLRSSLWIIPFVALPLQQVAWLLARTLDTRFAWKGLALGVTGAQAMFNAVITLTLSFLVFTFASLLVAIQVASGQYVAFRGQGCGQNGDDRSPISRVRRRASWFNLHRSFPVFDRLRGENAAPGQSGGARRQVRARGNGECLS